MKTIREDLPARQDVWASLQHFYLDTEPSEAELQGIAQRLSASPYTLPELDKIMFHEVWPALNTNLGAPIGEWAGWTSDFITERVLARHESGVWPWWAHPRKLFYCSSWFAMRQRIKALRRQHAPSAL